MARLIPVTRSAQDVPTGSKPRRIRRRHRTIHVRRKAPWGWWALYVALGALWGLAMGLAFRYCSSPAGS